jgi:signal peptidase I
MNHHPDDPDPAAIEPEASQAPSGGLSPTRADDASPTSHGDVTAPGGNGETPTPSWLGAPPSGLDAPPSQPGAPPSGLDAPPSQPGAPPSQPGAPPSQPGEPATVGAGAYEPPSARLLDASATPSSETPVPAARAGEPAQLGGGVPPGADHAAVQPSVARTRRERFRAWRFAPLVEVVATIALALVLAESVQAAVVKPFVIPSQSMEPTLLPGQRVLVNRLAYDFGGLPQRGDIVVFHPPSSLACSVNVPITEPCPRGVGSHASDYFVKRVIGLPGDRLSIKDGHPVINGRELTNEPYITPCTESTSCNMPHTIVIPRGEYYMLGDNRGDSDDSRYWGPVPLSWIIGEVFATYWPIDRIGFF